MVAMTPSGVNLGILMISAHFCDFLLINHFIYGRMKTFKIDIICRYCIYKVYFICRDRVNNCVLAGWLCRVCQGDPFPVRAA